MYKEKNVFLTNDIRIEDWDYENPDRYEYTRTKLNPDEYNFEFKSLKEWKKENILTKPEDEKTEYQEAKQKAFEAWAENELSYEETHDLPMMNALRYFPSFVDFEEEDRYKVSGATCLLYDNELDAWAGLFISSILSLIITIFCHSCGGRNPGLISSNVDLNKII